MNNYPAKLNIKIGGYFETTYHLKLKGKELLYGDAKCVLCDTLELKPVSMPSTRHWDDFWRTLDKLNVWEWKNKYIHTGVSSGTQWKINIILGDKQVKCQGNDAYPKDFGNFLKAACILISDQIDTGLIANNHNQRLKCLARFTGMKS